MISSTDGGKTFKGIDQRGVHGDHHAILIDPKSPQRVVIGNDGGDQRLVRPRRDLVEAEQPARRTVHDHRRRQRRPLQHRRRPAGQRRHARPVELPRRKDATRRRGEPIYGGDGSCVAIDPKDSNVVYAASQFGVRGAAEPEDRRARSGSRPRPELSAKKKEKPLRYNWISALHALAALARHPLFRHQPPLPFLRPRRHVDRDLRGPDVQPRAGRRPVRHDHDDRRVAEAVRRHLRRAPTRARSGAPATAARRGPDLSPGSRRTSGSRGSSLRASTREPSTSRRTVIATTSSRRTSSVPPTTERPGARSRPAFPPSRSTPSARTRRRSTSSTSGRDSGVFVSLDRGARGSRWRAGFPASPVHDLAVAAARRRPRRRHARPQRLRRRRGAAAQAEGRPADRRRSRRSRSSRSRSAFGTGTASTPTSPGPATSPSCGSRTGQRTGQPVKIRSSTRTGVSGRSSTGRSRRGMNVVEYDLSADPKLADAAEAKAREKALTKEKDEGRRTDDKDEDRTEAGSEAGRIAGGERRRPAGRRTRTRTTTSRPKARDGAAPPRAPKQAARPGARQAARRPAPRDAQALPPPGQVHRSRSAPAETARGEDPSERCRPSEAAPVSRRIGLTATSPDPAAASARPGGSSPDRREEELTGRRPRRAKSGVEDGMGTVPALAKIPVTTLQIIDRPRYRPRAWESPS